MTKSRTRGSVQLVEKNRTVISATPRNLRRNVFPTSPGMRIIAQRVVSLPVQRITDSNLGQNDNVTLSMATDFENVMSKFCATTREQEVTQTAEGAIFGRYVA